MYKTTSLRINSVGSLKFPFNIICLPFKEKQSGPDNIKCHNSKVHFKSLLKLPAIVCVCGFKGGVICFHEILIELHDFFFLTGYKHTIFEKKSVNCYYF